MPARDPCQQTLVQHSGETDKVPQPGSGGQNGTGHNEICSIRNNDHGQRPTAPAQPWGPASSPAGRMLPEGRQGLLLQYQVSPPSAPGPQVREEDGREHHTPALCILNRVFPKSCLLLMLMYHPETGVPEGQKGDLENFVTLNAALGVKNTFFSILCG